MTTTLPLSISGGCLCGECSYTIAFPLDQSGPKPHTCQCNHCRKMSGALLLTCLRVPLATFVWTKDTTLGSYEHTHENHRLFCTRCGSSLGWRSDKEDELQYMEIFVGTLDEEWLSPGSKVAIQVARPANNYWCKHQIPGVTDGPGGLLGDGPKYLNDVGSVQAV